MTRTEKNKLKKIVDFYNENGFDYTTEEIGQAVGITKKTLFNRYGSKKNMELKAIALFQEQLVERMESKIIFCNNSVESIIFLMDEIYAISKKSPFFFYKITQQGYHKSLYLLMEKLIVDGQNKHFFIKDLSIPLFVDFYFQTLFSFIRKGNFCADIITYVMSPLLTDKGKEALNDMDIENLIFGNPLLPAIGEME